MKKLQTIGTLLIVVLLSACATETPSFTQDDIAIIPKPLQMSMQQGAFKLNEKTKIYQSDETSAKGITFLNGLLEKAAGFSLKIEQKSGGNVLEFNTIEGLKEGAYNIKVNKEKVSVGASDESGFFNAVQTIRQLLPKEIEKEGAALKQWFVPCLNIEDEPRFSWRGMHTDFSRHFFDVEETKEFLDYLALYKMNTYHMHLTDDQGWRMEIKKYPLLTENGAWRIPNNQDTICNTRAEENDLYTIDEDKFKLKDGQRKYGGFFTQEQLKEIVAYADERCITIIPEIDMPGHFKSAIDNYPFLSCDGKSGWDTVFTYPACLGKETTYEFMKNVLSEVIEIFPSEYVHIGGDEVNIDSWKKCPLCQQAIKDNGLRDEHELQSHFNREIEQFLHAKGKKLLGWDEIVEGGLTEDATIMWWRGWRPEAPKKAVEHGNDLIITTTDAYYFDYLNDHNPLEKIYGYEPVPGSFTAEEEQQVLGIQANLWSEWIPSFQRLQYQAFPRMIAVAENAWAPKENKDFIAFNERVEKHYPRLDELGVFYYIPVVEGLNKEIVMVDSAQVMLKPTYQLKDVEIYYTTDGSEPTKKSIKYTEPFTVKDTLEIKARAYKGEIYNDLKRTKVVKTYYRTPTKVSSIEKGLKRFVLKGKYKEVSDLRLNNEDEWQNVETIGLEGLMGKDSINIIFTGYFNAKRDGVYEFETRSDGGDELYIGSELVVDNSGYHGPRKRYGQVALKKGWYSFELKYRPTDNPRVMSVRYGLQGEELNILGDEVLGF